MSPCESFLSSRRTRRQLPMIMTLVPSLRTVKLVGCAALQAQCAGSIAQRRAASQGFLARVADLLCRAQEKRTMRETAGQIGNSGYKRTHPCGQKWEPQAIFRGESNDEAPLCICILHCCRGGLDGDGCAWPGYSGPGPCSG